MSNKKNKTWDVKLFWRIMHYAKPYRLVFIATALLTIFLAILGIVKPIIIGNMVKDNISQLDKDGLLFWTLIVIALMIIEAVAQYYHSFNANWMGQSIVKDIRNELFRKTTHFKLKYFDKTPIGRLVTRAVSDMEAISEIFSEGILVIIGDVLKLVGVLIAMFAINWKLSLLIMVPIPILLIATNIFKRAIKTAYEMVRTQVAQLNTFVQEHVTGMNIVQIFGREKQEAKNFRNINAEHRDAHIKTVWAYSIFFPVVEILSALSLALLVIYLVMQTSVPGQDISTIASDLTTFILFIHMLYRPIRMLADRFNALQMGMVAAERVFDVLDTDERIVQEDNIKKPIEGNVSFKNVWFAYNDDEWVLKNISFDVKAGEKVALVGATGAGKSTIINLMSRFYEFQKGDILIDGVDIRKTNIEHLRNHISVVLQDVFLFSGSVLENITLNDKNITKEDVINAAKSVGAHQFISALPNDYNFDVRERGGMLSAGQRQLLSFIRAYVYNPKILVLDEATSSVDTETELLIQNAIEKLTENRTSIIIAHRLSTIKKADKIIVIDKGEIIESGTHDELLKLNGAYKRLYDLQFK
jgi:ATP-binding cassette, subfamily B, multidrug efflux pump